MRRVSDLNKIQTTVPC